MEKQTTNAQKIESIIEYRPNNDTSEFCYNNRTGGITIFSGESKWILPKQVSMLMLEHLILWDDLYNMLLIPFNKKIYTENGLLEKEVRLVSDTNFIDDKIHKRSFILLYNDSIFPKYIKKGDILGTGYLITKIESHCLKLK